MRFLRYSSFMAFSMHAPPSVAGCGMVLEWELLYPLNIENFGGARL